MYEIEELNEEVNWLSYIHDIRYDVTEVDTWKTDELVETTTRVDRYHDSLEKLNWSAPTKAVYQERLDDFEADVFTQGMESPGYVREAYVRKLADAIGEDRTVELISDYVHELEDEELAQLITDETRRGAEALGLIEGSTGVYPPGRARQRDEYRQAGLDISSAVATIGTIEATARVLEGIFGPEGELE